MKRNLLLLLTMVLLVVAGPIACKKGGGLGAQQAHQKQIIGHWIIDADETLALLPAEERDMAAMFINMMRMGMVFGEDGTLEMKVSVMGQEETQRSNYSVLAATATEVRFKIQQVLEEGEEAPAEEITMVATFQEGDRVAIGPIEDGADAATAVPNPSETIVLRRLSAEEFTAAMSAPAAAPDLGQMLGLPEGVDLEALMGEQAGGEEAPAAEGEEAPAAPAEEEAPAAE